METRFRSKRRPSFPSERSPKKAKPYQRKKENVNPNVLPLVEEAAMQLTKETPKKTVEDNGTVSFINKELPNSGQSLAAKVSMETRFKSKRRPSFPSEGTPKKRKPYQRKKENVNPNVLPPVEEAAVQLTKETPKKTVKVNGTVLFLDKELPNTGQSLTAKVITTNDNTGIKLSDDNSLKSRRTIKPGKQANPATDSITLDKGAATRDRSASVTKSNEITSTRNTEESAPTKLKKSSHSNTKSLSKEKKKALYRPGDTNTSKSSTTLKRSDFLIPKSTFKRLAEEVFKDVLQYRADDFRLSLLAVECMQECCEELMVSLFKTTQLIAMNSNRKTILRKDFILARRIRGMEKLHLF